MSTVFNWKFSAKILPSYTAENGEKFENVVASLEWRVTATDSATGEKENIYGEAEILRPEDPASFVSFADLADSEDENKKSLVFSWLESANEGFKAEAEDRVAQRLASKTANPRKKVERLL